MQSELKSLSKIFSECIFRIPDYQRGYSWETKHLKEFWNDIEQLPVSKNHYTGVLTLEPVKEDDYRRWHDDLWIIESKRYAPLYVVDGQQRLTTAVVLLQAILERMDDKEELNYTSKAEIRKKYIFESKDQGISRSYIFGYESDNPSYEFLKQSIFLEQSDQHSLPEDTIYTKNLGRAKSYFIERLRELDHAKLENLFTKLTQHLHFNIFYIEPDLDVFVTFETMNNRGKPLSHLELLKNRLIYLSTRFEVEKSERERLRRVVNESWKTVYHYLGRVASRRLNDDIFLRTHFACYFGPTMPRQSDDDSDDEEPNYQVGRLFGHDEGYKDHLLEEVFTPKRLSEGDAEKRLTIDEVYRYAQSIKSIVTTYFEVARPEEGHWSDLETIRLTQINRLGIYDLFLFSIAAVRKMQKGVEREKLLTAIERMGFLSRIRPYFFNNLDMEQMSIHLLADKISAEEVTKKAQSHADKFLSSGEFKESLRDLGKGGGYYSWNSLRYFMYEYEQHLRVLSKTTRQLLTWTDYIRGEPFDSDHRTVEHIFPQRASDPYWKNQFPGYTVRERNILRNSLGNLLPVSHAKNASLSNKSFDLKKGSASDQVGYRYGCLSEIQVSLEKDWGALQILRRGIALLTFMEQRWSIVLGSVSEKTELLGLEFVARREGVDANAQVALPLPVPPSQDDVATEAPKAPTVRRVRKQVDSLRK